MAKVYAVNMSRDDVSAARKYGDVLYVHFKYLYPDDLEGTCAPFRLPGAVRAEMENYAREFNPTEDILLIVGDHLQLVAFAALLGRLHGSFRVLRWDRTVSDYILVEV